MKADKILHALASYGIALTVFVIGIAFQFGVWTVPAVIVVTALAGVAKELGDRYAWDGTPEKGDLIADAVGLAAALLVIIIYYVR